jgi:hypothetical protein
MSVRVHDSRERTEPKQSGETHPLLVRPRLGFINKVKKIAECICVQCGKLKISPHEDPRLNDAVRFVRDPKKRLAIVHALVKGKMTCDMDVVDEEMQAKINAGEEVPKGHGGCGHDQPVLRREGLKLFLQYGRGKDEVSSHTRGDQKVFLCVVLTLYRAMLPSPPPDLCAPPARPRE